MVPEEQLGLSYLVEEWRVRRESDLLVCRLGLAGIFGRLWRGAFGRNGGLNKGAVGLGAKAGAGAGVGAGTGTGAGAG